MFNSGMWWCVHEQCSLASSTRFQLDRTKLREAHLDSWTDPKNSSKKRQIIQKLKFFREISQFFAQITNIWIVCRSFDEFLGGVFINDCRISWFFEHLHFYRNCFKVLRRKRICPKHLTFAKTEMTRNQRSTFRSILTRFLFGNFQWCLWKVQMEFNGASKTGLRIVIHQPHPEKSPTSPHNPINLEISQKFQTRNSRQSPPTM
jgi:hypothetical protein